MPQFFCLVMAVLLAVSAVQPFQTTPTYALHGVRSFLVPSVSAQKKVPVIKHVSVFVRPVPDCDVVKCIVLSFDDGPDPVTTLHVLDTLERSNTAASFFIVGKNVPGHEDILQRMHRDGFEIGNHSYSHPDFSRLSVDQANEQILATQQAIEAAGVPRPTLFRPPYGVVHPALADGSTMQIALWNEDPRDWAQIDSNVIVQTVVRDARPGGVIDLHDIHPVTAVALPAIIDQLTKQDYHFVTVSQLLHSRDRPGQAPFYGYRDEAPVN